MRRAAFASLLAALALVAASDVDAAPKKHEKKPPRSIGAPNHGKLEGGTKLHRGKSIDLRHGAQAYGVPELTHALKRAADKVASKHAGSIMLVGDLSAKDGGPLAGHNSHQTGRDADVGFYVENSHGKPVKSMKQFVAFDAKGEGKELAWARFDDARNWLLVETLIKDHDANVKHIYVVNSLRARLLAYAAKKQVNKELQQRAAQVMTSPPDADVHDNHFHIRIACPEASKGGCIEESVAKPAPDAAGG